MYIFYWMTILSLVSDKVPKNLLSRHSLNWRLGIRTFECRHNFYSPDSEQKQSTSKMPPLQTKRTIDRRHDDYTRLQSQSRAYQMEMFNLSCQQNVIVAVGVVPTEFDKALTLKRWAQAQERRKCQTGSRYRIFIN